MKVSIIVAMDRHNVIGKNGGLPWHLSADLQNFRKITMGKPLVMGRRTHESIGRPLPGRINIILTRQRDYKSDGCIVCHSLDMALEACTGHAEVMIVGGEKLYRQLLPRADRIYLTRVDAAVDGDTWFPQFDSGEWKSSGSETIHADDKNDFTFSFQVLERC